MTIPLHDLKGLLPDQLRQIATDLGEPSYRGDQLFEWLHVHQARDLDGMTNLPARFRQVLAEAGAQMPGLELLESSASDTGKAVKFLFDLGQGENGQGLGQVEAVLIIDGDRRTACLSSQVGCALDCKFCATAQMGFVRNLHAGQIVEQLHRLHQEAQRRGERLTNIVMMGMGEPLDNYDPTVDAIRLMILPEALRLSSRKITLSTAGQVDLIKKFQREDLHVNLAISLNATENKTRGDIMPINKKYPIEDLMDCLKNYPLKPSRRFTFEYVMLKGINDQNEDAKRLAKLLHGIPCKVNLIPFNKFSSSEYESPSEEQIHTFHQ